MATEIRELARAASPDTIGRQKWLDGRSDQLQKWFATVVEQGGAPAQALKDWLNGVWLGHPLHPALTDVPIGAWWIGLFSICSASPKEPIPRSWAERWLRCLRP